MSKQLPFQGNGKLRYVVVVHFNSGRLREVARCIDLEHARMIAADIHDDFLVGRADHLRGVRIYWAGIHVREESFTFRRSAAARERVKQGLAVLAGRWAMRTPNEPEGAPKWTQ